MARRIREEDAVDARSTGRRGSAGAGWLRADGGYLRRASEGLLELWDPLGEPMVRGIDAWAQMQRAYVQWLRQSMGNLP